MRTAVGLAWLVIAAGCLGASDDASSRPPDLTLLYEVEHDHVDPVVHELAWNIEQVAYHSATSQGAPSGIIGELDVAGDLLAAHIQGARSGLVLFNISDPTAPEFLAFADAEAYRPYEARDVKLDPAGQYAYLALQLGGLTQLATPPASPTAAGGFLVFDVTDPASPVLVSQAIESGRGCHMIRYWESGGTRVVYCMSSQGLAIWEVFESALSPRDVRKRPGYFTEELALVAEDVAGSADPGNPTDVAMGALTALQPHDVTAQLDPITGDPILVVAYENYGIEVLDISSPLQPVPISAWRWEGAANAGGRMHTALMHAVGEQRLAIGVNEAGGAADVTPFFIVDMTDYSAPTLLAEWVPPAAGETNGLVHSTHNIQAVGTILYMAHFHAGVWAFDISEVAAPTPVAVFSRTQPSLDEAAAAGFGGAPFYWDVVVHDGYMLVSDMPSGLVVLHRDGDPAGEPTWDSFV